jgi:anaphase-promoting complex subunit 1
MVMAGSGNLSTLEKLIAMRSMFGDDMNYGCHMAWSMSLGLLFLGNGTCTIGTSKKAVAAMFCSFFPLYPSSATDNRYHLQALRHMWVLAIEKRCLVTKDVTSGEIESVPVEIVIKPEAGGVVRKIRTFTPAMLPDIAKIDHISIVGPRYYHLTHKVLAFDRGYV